jgi:hypothetical protein
LYNFTDSPDDFWRRIVETQNIVCKVGRPIVLFPQRYDPLNSLKKHQYIGPKWTDEMLRGLKLLYTKSGRNFITINKTANTYRWFCFKKEDFFDKLKRIGKGTKIDKFEGDIIYEIYY